LKEGRDAAPNAFYVSAMRTTDNHRFAMLTQEIIALMHQCNEGSRRLIHLSRYK